MQGVNDPESYSARKSLTDFLVPVLGWGWWISVGLEPSSYACAFPVCVISGTGNIETVPCRGLAGMQPIMFNTVALLNSSLWLLLIQMGWVKATCPWEENRNFIPTWETLAPAAPSFVGGLTAFDQACEVKAIFAGEPAWWLLGQSPAASRESLIYAHLEIHRSFNVRCCRYRFRLFTL